MLSRNCSRIDRSQTALAMMMDLKVVLSSTQHEQSVAATIVADLGAS